MRRYALYLNPSSGLSHFVMSRDKIEDLYHSTVDATSIYGDAWYVMDTKQNRKIDAQEVREIQYKIALKQDQK